MTVDHTSQHPNIELIITYLSESDAVTKVMIFAHK